MSWWYVILVIYVVMGAGLSGLVMFVGRTYKSPLWAVILLSLATFILWLPWAVIAGALEIKERRADKG